MNRRSFFKLAGGASAALALPALWKSMASTGFTPENIKIRTISIHIHPQMPWQKTHADAVAAGFRRHGLNPSTGTFNVPVDSDLAVMWGWKQPMVIADAKRRGAHILVMEDGFIQPRHEWCSLAFDGLNGLGIFPPAPGDDGKRWRTYFASLLKPWREDKKGYALLIGQVPGDPALHGMDIYVWLRQKANALHAQGWEVIYRPHPDVRRTYGALAQPLPIPAGTTLSTGTLAEDLAGAAFTVIYDSTTAVESLLAGVPAVIESKGSIAWEMGANTIDAPFYYPERLPWCQTLAWKQWRMEELADGTAWELMKQAI